MHAEPATAGSESPASVRPVPLALDGEVRQVVRASRTYFASHALLLLAGLFSMPLMTRLLSKAEYGVLSVVLTTTSMLALLGGLGFGDAAVRLYEEGAADSRRALRALCETLLSGACLASTVVALGAALVLPHLSGDTPAVPHWAIAAFGGLVVVRALSTVVFQLYRAQGRALAYATTQLGIRYATTLVAVAALLVWSRSAFVVVAASLAVETLVLVWNLADFRRRGLIARPRLSPAAGAALAYGFPLALAGVARYLLNYGDRLMIEHMVGLEAVATYSVPYDIAQRLGDALTVPVQLAVIPILFRLWTQEGAQSASRLASRVLTYLVAFGIPITALYLLYNEDIIVFLASAKYRESAALSLLLLPGTLCGSLTFLVSVGLTAQKRSLRVALNVCGAAALNVTLNLVLIPVWHLTGAAIATSVSYAALLAAHYAAARDGIRLRVGSATVAKAALATALAVALLAATGRIPARASQDLLVSLAAGAAAAMALFAAFDPQLRGLLLPAPRAAAERSDARAR